MNREKLNNVPHEFLVEMYMQLQRSFDIINDQLETVQGQNTELMKQLKNLQDKVDILTEYRFGRKSEKNLSDPGQLTLNLETGEVFNEAEQLADEHPLSEEPDIEEVIVRRRKSKGKRAEDIKDVERIVEPTITIPDEELAVLFPSGYRMLPDEVYTDLEFIPAKFVAHEHHYAVYAGKGDKSLVVRASRDYKALRILDNSLLTSSLMAGIIDDKYVNHMPANRIHEDFLRKGVEISRQRLAHWCIYIAERYLSHMYERMKQELRKARLLHSDETPFVLRHHENEEQRSKDYMWVYHTDQKYGSPSIYVYDYPLNGSRNVDAISKFLAGFNGILVTDGYQVYHSLEKKDPDRFTVAGCWVHARRKFAEYLKSNKANVRDTIALEAVQRISSIYDADKSAKDKSEEEHLQHRKEKVKPLVDAYFAWVKTIATSGNIDKGNAVYRASSYSINQEKFLREFLNNPIIPLDNNDAERSIRSFCIGKHNWYVIDTPKGATSSAMLYSIAETAKANNLKTFEYLKYLLDQLVFHSNDRSDDYLDDLVPWSDKLPDSCRKTK
ncbi:IS66 family transposase [Anaerocolumna sp. MB42-C2]|uniref:IS66 family transposase n=1 Tax=Anaerocolumna sp. MB42-C2 TaxID=3070997 RepID=UPI0027E15B48|nr:IS66 family transposase [Anaerocolumna sp. MB42-C2]WMJ90195.1 IS66 family transposase [Anaerocolumna sp. MB42-C2]